MMKTIVIILNLSSNPAKDVNINTKRYIYIVFSK